jgi:hypothetical protein
VSSDRPRIERQTEAQPHNSGVVADSGDEVLPTGFVGKALRDPRHDLHGLRARGFEVLQVVAVPVPDDISSVVQIDEEAGPGDSAVLGRRPR